MIYRYACILFVYVYIILTLSLYKSMYVYLDQIISIQHWLMLERFQRFKNQSPFSKKHTSITMFIIFAHITFIYITFHLLAPRRVMLVLSIFDLIPTAMFTTQPTRRETVKVRSAESNSPTLFEDFKKIRIDHPNTKTKKIPLPPPKKKKKHTLPLKTSTLVHLVL